MDYDRINILLEKYWECETSLEEEKELRAFFATNQEGPWAKEAALFRYFEETRNSGKLGEFFDHRILEEITKQEKIQGKGKTRSLWMNIGKVAAVIIILVSAVTVSVIDFNEKKAVISEIDTFDDPKKAFEETKRTLMLISQSMGSGKKQVEKIKIFNEAQETIKNDVEPEFDNDKK
jgi:hypothetical protein